MKNEKKTKSNIYNSNTSGSSHSKQIFIVSCIKKD